MELAPIVIFVYNRVDNIRKTVEALMKNKEAKESSVFIFSDGAKNDKDEIEVEKVRNYIRKIRGFKKLEIIESQENKGLANSVIAGVSKIINEYGKAIVLEDDIITSSSFLAFMNKCLDIYCDRKDIWSISAYSPTINIPYNYNDEVFLSIRGASWGWATWSDRWNSIDWNIISADKLLRDKEFVREFNNAGNDLSRMLYEYLKGRIDSWAIRWYYTQFNQKKYTVFPIKSLIYNSGFNYNGTHGANKKLACKLNTNAINFMPKINLNVEVNEEINNKIKKLYDIEFSRRIVFMLRKYGFYKIIICIKKLKVRMSKKL